MKDVGELRYFLDMEVIQSPKRIWLLQRQYALNKLSEYGMMGYKPISIPLEQNVKLSVDEGDLVENTTMWGIPQCGEYPHSGEFDLHDHHKAKFGYGVGLVSQFMQTPRKPHLDALKHILRYIKHILQCGIFYEAKS
jgi:hypothetical protein